MRPSRPPDPVLWPSPSIVPLLSDANPASSSIGAKSSMLYLLDFTRVGISWLFELDLNLDLDLDLIWIWKWHWNMNAFMDIRRRHDCLASRISHLASRIPHPASRILHPVSSRLFRRCAAFVSLSRRLVSGFVFQKLSLRLCLRRPVSQNFFLPHGRIQRREECKGTTHPN
jgi:hypothetical protein